MSRIVCWFSCGASSAVATYFTLLKYGSANVNIVNIHLIDEHPDNQRFLKSCENWYGKEIEVITSEKYHSSVDEVIEKTKFLRSVYGARCTKELKKAVRFEYQKPDDKQIFGYGVNEKKRIKHLLESDPFTNYEFPLVEHNMTGEDCRQFIHNLGIEVPTMYKLGFRNNNCIGCLKAESPTYWNHVRKHFPEVFEKRAKQERMVGYALCRYKGQSIFLDELDPYLGRGYKMPDFSCGAICEVPLDN